MLAGFTRMHDDGETSVDVGTVGRSIVAVKLFR